MKKIFFLILIISGFNAVAQFGYQKWFLSGGITGKYLTAPKYTGYDFNVTFIPRYNFAQLSK